MARLLIVAAAGMGRRLGRDEPKALVDLAGRPLISRTLDALGAVSFARAVVVAPPGHETDFQAAVGGRAGIISGGPRGVTPSAPKTWPPRSMPNWASSPTKS